MEFQPNTENQPYALLVELEVAQKNVQAVCEVLTELQNFALEEKGCNAYEILQSEENSGKIYLYECYENLAAHNIHANSNYFRDIVPDKLNPLIMEKRITKVVTV